MQISQTFHNLDRYDRPSVTVDVVIFSLAMGQSDLRVLLVQRSRQPFVGLWSLPGGFVQIDESLESAAARQLAAKTGLESVYIEQLFTFGDPQRDPRRHVITVAYSALVPYTIIEEPAADAPLQWFSVYDRPKLAFDHATIVDYALQRLRYKLEYTSVGFELLPNEFTLSSLQQAYEIVLAEKLDKRNFRRKILSADIIQETGKKSRSGEGRPAKLYRYQDNAVAEIKARRLFP